MGFSLVGIVVLVGAIIGVGWLIAGAGSRRYFTSPLATGNLSARPPTASTNAAQHKLSSGADSASLAELAVQLAHESDRWSLFGHAADWLHENSHYPLVIIYGLDSNTNELINPIIAGKAPIALPRLPNRIKAGVTIYGDVARNRLAHYTDNVLNEPRFWPTAAGILSAYTVPLVDEAVLYGVLSVQTTKESPLSLAQRAAIDRTAVLLAAMAAANVHLTNSQQAITRFNRFQQLTQRLTTRLETSELLQEIADAAREMLDTEMSVLLEVQKDSVEMKPIAWAGISRETAQLLRSRFKGDLKGLVAWARKPARTPDLMTDQRTASASHAVVAGMMSELAAPVMHFDRLYGVLAVQTTRHRHFTDEEMDLLSALAAQAGIALRNAQLFENLQLSNRQLERTVADLVISQQQTENARLAAVEASKLKTEFVSNMSHELRTPLNAVINFTRIVMDGHAGAVTEDQVQYLNYVHDSGQHLLGLINDILDLAKIEAGKMELRQELESLEPILRGVMTTAIGLTRDKGLELRTEIAPDLPRLYIDSTRIRQVMLNLLSNAAKFTVKGSISVQAEQKDQQIIIAVQDTGIGIKPEDLPKVFEEFRQVDNSLQREETGTGLGMPISRRFVQLHGGEMWLESTFGVGTTVYVSLPVASIPPTADAVVTPNGPETSEQPHDTAV